MHFNSLFRVPQSLVAYRVRLFGGEQPQKSFNRKEMGLLFFLSWQRDICVLFSICPKC